MRSLEQQVLFFTGKEGSLSMQLHEQDDTGVDVGSNETGSARTSADPGRPGRGRLRPLAAGLAAFAALLALPLQAEAQKTTFVSNTGQSTDPDVREVGPHGHLWQLQAQQFSTGDNEGGYTLSAIQVRVDDFGSNSRPKVSIYTTSSGNPGTSLYVLTNPATLNDDAINTFRAPANATLEKDTNYFVVFEELGSGSNLRYDLEVTTSNAEDSGKASGWNIANSSRQRSTTATTWDNLAGKLKIAVRGTLPPAISIADASAAENAGHLLFEVTLSRSFQNTVKVDFETISGGTATEGVDYHARRTYTHVILAGDKTAQMGFALIEDTVAAAGETVMVRLSNARVVDAYGDKIKDLDITRAEATGTITAPPTTTTNVPGLTIGIQDATGDEDDGWLDFRVRLSKKYDDYVCYDFETISGGNATEGTDYLKIPKATYWMQIGKRVDKPFVRIIDDRVNDNGETVKVKISNARLCNDPSQTLSITRAEATGTIRNSDPLPQALMARFGRTVAVHVVERVEERMAASREAGFEAQFAGRQLRPGMGRELVRDFLSQLGASADRRGPGARGALSGSPVAAAAGSMGLAVGPMDGMAGPDGGLFDRGLHSMGLGGGNLLTGSSFAFNRETRQGGMLSFWSRGARSSFAGREGPLGLDGDVRTTMVGADYAKGPMVVGLSLAHSRGQGGYHGLSSASSGHVASSVTGLYPWMGYTLSDRVSVWGVTGYGKGRPDVDARRGNGARERVVDGHGGRRPAGRADRFDGGRIRAGVQGGCAVGRHRDRRRGRTGRKSGCDLGGGDPLPDGAGSLARLSLRARALAPAQPGGGTAARRRGRRDRRGRGHRRRPDRIGRGDRAVGRLQGPDAAGAPGRRVPGAGHVGVVWLQPDAVDAAGLSGEADPVLGRTGRKRRPGALGPGDDGGDGGRRSGSGRPSGGRARLRDAGRGPFGRDAELRHRGLRARARLPAGLRPDGGARRCHALRAGHRCQSPGKPLSGNCGAWRFRPAHGALVEVAPGSCRPRLSRAARRYRPCRWRERRILRNRDNHE